MPAADSPTLLAVARPAELLGAADNHQALALVAPVPNSMRPPVRAVDVQPPYHSFLVKTVPSTATNAFRPSAPRVALAVKSPAVIATIATAMSMAPAVSAIAAAGAAIASAGNRTKAMS
jgi:hypothetical protein